MLDATPGSQEPPLKSSYEHDPDGEESYWYQSGVAQSFLPSLESAQLRPTERGPQPENIVETLQTQLKATATERQLEEVEIYDPEQQAKIDTEAPEQSSADPIEVKRQLVAQLQSLFKVSTAHQLGRHLPKIPTAPRGERPFRHVVDPILRSLITLDDLSRDSPQHHFGDPQAVLSYLKSYREIQLKHAARGDLRFRRYDDATIQLLLHSIRQLIR